MFSGMLNYSGVAWPSAKVVGSNPVEYKPAIPGLPIELPKSWRSLRIVAVGRQKPWTTTNPQAFWRSLGELAPSIDTDQSKLADGFTKFVRRFGPLTEPTSDELEERAGRRGEPTLKEAFERIRKRNKSSLDSEVCLETNTGDWLTATHYFAEIAKAWEPEDAAGVSRLSANRMRRDTALHWLNLVLAPAMNDSRLVFDAEMHIVLKAYNLYSFMAFSAASAWREQAVMRRCAHCQFWFEPSRIDALYCSTACRANAHRAAHVRPDRVLPRSYKSSRKKAPAHG